MREFCELYKTLIELCNSTLNSAKSDISSIDKKIWWDNRQQ